jgi:hypothetical protein
VLAAGVAATQPGWGVSTGRLADPTDLPFDENHLEDPDALFADVVDLLARKTDLASRRPVGEIGRVASPSATRRVDLPELLRQRAQQDETMADLKELADQAAAELLKAIRDQTGKAGESSLLDLAQAYSVLSARSPCGRPSLFSSNVALVLAASCCCSG